MRLSYSGLTDVGNVRANNEDYQFAGPIGTGGDEYLFIVADGMGGHNAGEVASRKAVTQVVNRLEKSKRIDIARELENIIVEVNDSLYRESSRMVGKDGMGTTLSVLYIKGGAGYIAHVGDSRIYLYSETGVDRYPQTPSAPDATQPEDAVPQPLTQLTEDHSLVGRLLQDGLITEEEARHHPRRNVIHQSIGLKPKINVQVLPPIPLVEGGKFLLCSDGLHGVLTDRELGRHLAGNSASQIARQLIRKAKVNGAPDNVTAIVVSTSDDPQNTAPETSPEELPDTVKIAIPTSKRNNRRRVGFFILLGLLLMLLAALVFLLVTTGQSNQHTGLSTHTPSNFGDVHGDVRGDIHTGDATLKSKGFKPYGNKG
ncbi:MAG: serine/threonine-protein phosphatase [bacterium]|nr:serine/threonine-protein phosphatase [bacterium]